MSLTYLGTLGMWAGIIAGLAVALGWCWMMRRRSGGIGAGVLYGLLAAVACAAAVHAVLLIAAYGELKHGALSLALVGGLVFAVVSGPIVGLICGAVWGAKGRAPKPEEADSSCEGH